MYKIVQLAALSAALAAALVTAFDSRNASPSPARFLTDRLDTQVVPLPASVDVHGDAAANPAGQRCLARAWPYPDDCAAPSLSSTSRNIRIIGLDTFASGSAGSIRLPSRVAQR